MSWREEQTIIRRGKLVALLLSGGLSIAIVSLALGVLLTAILTEPPAWLVVGLLAAFVLRLLFSLAQTISYYVRRSARRRRVRGRV